MNKEELKKQLEKCNRYLELKNSDNLVYDMLDIFENNEIVYEYIQYANNLQQENQQLKEKLECSQTNEETYRLEMLDITKMLGLKENELFDDVKKYANNLQQRYKQLQDRINKAIEYIEENINSNQPYIPLDLLEILKGNDYEKENK